MENKDELKKNEIKKDEFDYEHNEYYRALTDFRRWKQQNRIRPISKKDRDKAYLEWIKDYTLRTHLPAPEYERVKNHEEQERLKIVKKGRIEDIALRSIMVLAVVAVISTIGYAIYDNIKFRKAQYDENGIPKRLPIESSIATPFDKSYDFVFDNDEAIREYKSQYIYFLKNNETGEFSEFVMFNGREYNNKAIVKHVYDFETEELLAYEKDFPDLFESRYLNQIYYDYLEDNFTWYTLKDAIKLLDEKYKDHYTKEEIMDIEDRFIKRLNQIDEAKRLNK